MAWIPAALRRVLALVAASLISLSASAAPRVAALIPQVRPNSTPEMQNRFHEALTRGMQGPDADVLPAAEVRLRFGVNDELLGCVGPGICAARSASALKTDRQIGAEISIFGKDYIIRMVMTDPAGREVSRTEEPCDICTAKEAEDAVAKAAARLMVSLRTNPPQAQTNAPPPEPPKPAEPPPAPKSTTPEPAPPPEPKEALPPGAQPEPEPPGALPTRPIERRHFPWLGLGIGSLVVGVVLVAVGAPLIAIDGQPTCDPGPGKDPKTACPDVWDTGPAGSALVTLGVLGVAAGVSLIVVDTVVRKHKTRVSMAPTSHGAMLTGQWQF